MPLIRLGDQALTAFRVGSQTVDSMYVGSTRVWPLDNSNSFQARARSRSAVSSRISASFVSVARSRSKGAAVLSRNPYGLSVAQAKSVSRGSASLLTIATKDFVGTTASRSASVASLAASRAMAATARTLSQGGATIDTGDGPVYSCTMMAGNVAGVLFGYARSGDSIGLGPFGSLSAQPVPGEVVDVILNIAGGANYFFFVGDVSVTLAGLSLWVDGVNYGLSDANWYYDAGNDRTIWYLASGGPPYADLSSYAIEIK